MTINTLTPNMLNVMTWDKTKAAGLQIKLTLKDGSKRRGVYLDLMPDPLHRLEFKDVLFIKFRTKQEDMIVYLPITLIDTIDWAAGGTMEDDNDTKTES